MAARKAVVVPEVALLCQRCGRPFKTATIRTLCGACAAGGAEVVNA